MSDRIERRLAAILVADIVGFSAQMEADEAGTLDRLRRCRRDLIDPGLEKHRGRMIKTMGDGVLIEFALMDEVIEGTPLGYKDMKREDALAIADYLKSIPPIVNKIK